MVNEKVFFVFDFRMNDSFYSEPSLIIAVLWSRERGIIKKFAGCLEEYSGFIPSEVEDVLKSREDYLELLLDFLKFYKENKQNIIVLAHDKLKTKIFSDSLYLKLIDDAKEPHPFINLMGTLNRLGKKANDVNDYIKESELPIIGGEKANENLFFRIMNIILAFDHLSAIHSSIY